jgi:DNA polymerase-4
MERLGILTGADLAAWPIEQLEAHFGSSGRWYWRIARGIDEREVKPDRPYKSVSAERTFDVDYSNPEDLRREVNRVAGYAWQRIERAEVKGRTVTLKVKFADFAIITRSKSFAAPVADLAAFEAAGQSLLDSILPVRKGVRLLGLGLHSIIEQDESVPEQLGLAI